YEAEQQLKQISDIMRSNPGSYDRESVLQCNILVTLLLVKSGYRLDPVPMPLPASGAAGKPPPGATAEVVGAVVSGVGTTPGSQVDTEPHLQSQPSSPVSGYSATQTPSQPLQKPDTSLFRA